MYTFDCLWGTFSDRLTQMHLASCVCVFETEICYVALASLVLRLVLGLQQLPHLSF